jgi:cytochrome c oxidase cbb3-type subunit IV
MDINVARILVTVASFAVFVGIFLWAYSAGRQARFEEAAALPFREGDE